MSKREHGHMNGAVVNEGSRRSKRRREVGDTSSDIDVMKSDPIEQPKANFDDNILEEVKEKGLVLWTTVRDAVNKDGVSISAPFLHKVPRRQYPDYYELIKQPIALDDIKKKLDHHGYSSLQAVKSDFELLFSNAKEYNQPESAIWRDAKDLWKLVQKTYNKLVPSNDEDEKKLPSLNRLMKSRLEKLIEKQDPTGRILSTEFMELPSKKDWAIYYKQIKKPQCLEAILKHIKRREYNTSDQFAADVELVFSNALTFNQDNTPIWNDALALRDYFRQLMSDMPPQYAIPEYAAYASSKPSNKIKIKPPQSMQPVASNSTQQKQNHEQGHPSSLLLRVPAAHPPSSTKPSPQASVPASHVDTPHPQMKAPAPVETNASSTPKPSKPQSKTQSLPQPQQIQQQQKQQTKLPTPQPPIQTVSFINATPSHYPRTPHVPPPPVQTPKPVAPVATAPVFHPKSGMAPYSTSQSPAPVVLPLNHQLKSINLRIQPRGRELTLDHRDGVKSWAVRLVPGESSMILSNVAFLGDNDNEEDGSSAEEEDADKDDDYDMDVDVESGLVSPSKNGRKKGKARGRGRPSKAVALAAKSAATKAAKVTKKKPIDKVGEIQLKLNNFVVKEQPDAEGEWNVYLPIGTSTIEIGEIGGMVWKVYTERLADV